MNPHPLRTLIETCDAAISRRDFDALMAFYAEDAALVVKPGMVARGIPAIRRAFTAISDYFGGRLEVTQGAMEVIEGADNALVIMETRLRYPDAQGNFLGYGEGWQLSDYRGRKLIWHSGAVSGQISFTALLPGLDFGFTVWSNAEEPGVLRWILKGDFSRFVKEIVAKFVPKEEREAAKPPSAGEAPRPQWLEFVVTGKARTSIRAQLKHLQHEDAVQLGHRMLDRALESLGRSKPQQIGNLAEGQFRIADVGHRQITASVVEDRAKLRAFLCQFAPQGPGRQLQACRHFFQVGFPATIEQRPQ